MMGMQTDQKEPFSYSVNLDKRARWRRLWRQLWRQQIQDYMIAAVQNIRILIRHGDRQPTATVQALHMELQNSLQAIYASIFATLHALGCFGCCMSPSGFIADTTYSGNVIFCACVRGFGQHAVKA